MPARVGWLCICCLARTSLPGSGRRCPLASSAALLASSLDFLQGTFEKIHFQRLFPQQPLQLLGLLTVGQFVRVRPSRLFSRLYQIEFSPPFVETPPGYPQFLRQVADVLAAFHALYCHPLKLPGVSLPFHFAAPFPAKCALPLCLSSRVQSIWLRFVTPIVHEQNYRFERQKTFFLPQEIYIEIPLSIPTQRCLSPGKC